MKETEINPNKRICYVKVEMSGITWSDLATRLDWNTFLDNVEKTYEFWSATDGKLVHQNGSIFLTPGVSEGIFMIDEPWEAALRRQMDTLFSICVALAKHCGGKVELFVEQTKLIKFKVAEKEE